jgi:serine/threonine-protein kinase RsbW
MTAVHLTLRNDINELERVVAAVDQLGLSPELVPDVNVVLEELISNTIFYGLPEGAAPESLSIDLRMETKDGRLTLRLEDNGKAYDPLRAAPPDISGDVENRPVGGLGIHLVRSLMDGLEYRREADHNVMIMTRRLGKMDIQEEKVGGVTAISLKGRLDAIQSKAVEEKVLSLIDGGARKLLLDLDALEYISSIGLRVFMLAAKRMKVVGGEVAVCRMRDPIRKLFEIAGFLPLFRTFATREEAVAALGS